MSTVRYFNPNRTPRSRTNGTPINWTSYKVERMNAKEIMALAERAGLTFFLNKDLEAGVADDAKVLKRLERALTATPRPPSNFEMDPEALDIRTHVLHMRDYFLTLVHAYNTVGAYDSAAEAQRMAIAAHKFANERMLYGLAWPPEVVDDGEGEKGLRTTAGGVTYGSEL